MGCVVKVCSFFLLLHLKTISLIFFFFLKNTKIPEQYLLWRYRNLVYAFDYYKNWNHLLSLWCRNCFGWQLPPTPLDLSWSSSYEHFLFYSNPGLWISNHHPKTVPHTLSSVHWVETSSQLMSSVYSWLFTLNAISHMVDKDIP